MIGFLMESASGECRVEFFERTPCNSALPIERFKVRLTDRDLSAVARIYVDSSGEAQPASLFSHMAERWRGWPGTLAWDSSDGILSLRCTGDHAGRVSIWVAIRSGPGPGDWSAAARIALGAGQLEDLAGEAVRFFGVSEEAIRADSR